MVQCLRIGPLRGSCGIWLFSSSMLFNVTGVKKEIERREEKRLEEKRREEIAREAEVDLAMRMNSDSLLCPTQTQSQRLQILLSPLSLFLSLFLPFFLFPLSPPNPLSVWREVPLHRIQRHLTHSDLTAPQAHPLTHKVSLFLLPTWRFGSESEFCGRARASPCGGWRVEPTGPAQPTCQVDAPGP